MHELIEYIKTHAQRGSCRCGQCADAPASTQQPEGHTADLVFFEVAINHDTWPEPDDLRNLIIANRAGANGYLNLFDGESHNFIEVGYWLGDQASGLMLMGLGSLLGLWQIETPYSLVTWNPELREQLAFAASNSGMVSICCFPDLVQRPQLNEPSQDLLASHDLKTAREAPSSIDNLYSYSVTTLVVLRNLCEAAGCNLFLLTEFLTSLSDLVTCVGEELETTETAKGSTRAYRGRARRIVTVLYLEVLMILPIVQEITKEDSTGPPPLQDFLNSLTLLKSALYMERARLDLLDARDRARQLDQQTPSTLPVRVESNLDFQQQLLQPRSGPAPLLHPEDAILELEEDQLISDE